jgi:hypothetical protein
VSLVVFRLVRGPVEVLCWHGSPGTSPGDDVEKQAVSRTRCGHTPLSHNRSTETDGSGYIHEKAENNGEWANFQAVAEGGICEQEERPHKIV